VCADSIRRGMRGGGKFDLFVREALAEVAFVEESVKKVHHINAIVDGVPRASRWVAVTLKISLVIFISSRPRIVSRSQSGRTTSEFIMSRMHSNTALKLFS
jgi:hypothetical protein